MALVLMLSLLAARDGRLAAAVERYESARFVQARDALLELVDDGELSTAERIEARTYLAACYLALRDRGSARLQLRELARQHPEAMPSPASFTPELVALADEVWDDVQKKKPPQPAPSRPPDATPPEVVERSPPPRAPSARPSRALAFIPFGGGHFARGETGAGAAWFAATVVPFALSLIGFARVEDLKVSGEVGQRGVVPRGDFGEATAWNHIYPIAFFAGVAVLVLNVIVANLTWPEGGGS